jgi:pSer/pThr/pTyr-binding forkhead associated (FHA) protein
MPDSPLAPHRSSPAELRERLRAERRGTPFLEYRDGDATQQLVELPSLRSPIALGRSPECPICLSWDPQVSRLHAELECVGEHWLVVDDGLSINGTFVLGERVRGRRRLRDGDLLELGGTTIAFRAPSGRMPATTRLSDREAMAASVTASQRRVVVALCRPFKGSVHDATPTTNPQIAAELCLTVAAVKTHLRAVFREFGIDELPQSEKRRRLVALAFATGLVSDRDL